MQKGKYRYFSLALHSCVSPIVLNFRFGEIGNKRFGFLYLLLYFPFLNREDYPVDERQGSSWEARK